MSRLRAGTGVVLKSDVEHHIERAANPLMSALAAALSRRGCPHGTDVFRALSLGAEAIVIGRPQVHGLALGGEDGVTHMLRTLLAELLDITSPSPAPRTGVISTGARSSGSKMPAWAPVRRRARRRAASRASRAEARESRRRPECGCQSLPPTAGFRRCARVVSNHRPLACEASALPLSYARGRISLERTRPRRDRLTRTTSDAEDRPPGTDNRGLSCSTTSSSVPDQRGVLAARLSEDPDVSVLLVEAGPPDTKENVHVPAAFGSLFKTDVDWDFSTAPEEGCNGRMMFLPRGKVLGGSSSINAMVYIRGNRADYDGWRDAGHLGWGYDDLLPYFRKSEDNERGESEYHGVGGPLTVSDVRSQNPISLAWIEAAKETGLPSQRRLQRRRSDRRRHVPGDPARRHALLDRGGVPAPGRRPAEPDGRDPHAGHRIVIEGGRAVGVAGERHGEPVELRAEREVILCAGAYNSPQLLMLSGIGPAEHLAMKEIEVAVDLPDVGENLQDHLNDGAIWTTEEPVSLILGAEPEYQEMFANEGAARSRRTSPRPAASGGRTRLDAPDIQFHAAPVMFVDEGLGDPVAHGVTFGACLLTPKSRGSVTLRSADPTAKPWIRHNFLTDPRRGDDDRGAAADDRHLPGARARAVLPGALHRPGQRRRGGAARPPGPSRADALPPGRHVRDGSGGRRAARGARGRGAARGRRVGDAGHTARQHQRPDDRRGRARRRPDQGPHAAACVGGHGRGSRRALVFTADRARRGCSGALHPQSALVGLNSRSRDESLGASTPVRGVDGPVPRGWTLPNQVRTGR